MAPYVNRFLWDYVLTKIKNYGMISLTSKEGYQMSGKYMAYVGSYSYSGTAKVITVYDEDV